jgi:DNA-binding CsgD family transcriptional regulator
VLFHDENKLVDCASRQNVVVIPACAYHISHIQDGGIEITMDDKITEVLEEIADEYSLSKREKELLIEASNGHEDKSIAYRLGVSYSTITTMWSRIYKKIGSNSKRAILARVAILAINRMPSDPTA